MRTRRYILAFTVAILLLCTAAAVRGVSHESYWYDEVWSLKYAGGAQYGPASLIDTAQRVIGQAGFERTPPLYYEILNLWIHLVGSSEFSTRVLSILTGLVAVAWIFRAGWDFAADTQSTPRFAMAIGATVTLATSAYFIEYMQEVRAYIFLMLLIGMNLALYRRLLRLPHRPSIGLQLALLLAMIALLWIHFTAVLFFLALGLYHLLFERRSLQFGQIAMLALCSLFPLILLKPLVTAAAQNTYTGYLPNALSAFAVIRDLFISFSSDSIALFVFLLATALLVRNHDARLLWFVTVLSLAGALVLNQIIGFIVIVRYIIFLLPLLALLTGLGLSQLARQKIPLVPILAIWIAAGVFTSADFSQTRVPYNLRMSWIDMVAVMRPHIQADDVIMFHSPLWPWQQRPEFDHYMYPFSNRRSLTEDIFGLQAKNEYFNNATQFLGSAQRVWLGVDMTMPANFRLAEMLRAMSSKYIQCYTALDTKLTRLDLYASIVGSNNPPLARFGDGIDVVLNERLPAQVKGNLSVLLGTHLADSVPRSTYSIGLHIDDANGKLVANQDFGLPNQSDSCKSITIDVSGLTNGPYQLFAVVYDWRTSKRLNAILGTGGMSTGNTPLDRVSIGAFTVRN